MASDPGSDIRLILGLGNPGSAYGQHRHNVGYWCLNRLAREWHATFRASRLASQAEVEEQGQRVVLAKSRTFMNESGRAAAALLRRYRLEPRQMLVVCDSLDLPVGRLRLRDRGSHGGHNGLRSIIAAIGSQEFARLRVGIGRPEVDGRPTTDPEVIAQYVLSPPTPDERRLLEEAVAQAVEALVCVAHYGLEVATNRYNS